MTVLVTGVCGQLGHDVMNELAARGWNGVGSDVHTSYSGALDDSPVCTMPYVQMDITDADAVRKTVTRLAPDAVIHCAAWTAVDAAEDAANTDKVFAVNAGGTENIARVCAEVGCRMMYISTDYVFNGRGSAPWMADCEDFEPQNVYGKSKLAGEQAVRTWLEKFFIVRISWVFGLNGANFVKTMLRIGAERDAMNVVSDQIGTPTYTFDLARLLVDMIATDHYGVYHATNEGGYISWCDFAREIFRQAGMNTLVHPVTTAEYASSKATRPLNSRLDKSKLIACGFAPLPDWRDALARYLRLAGR